MRSRKFGIFGLLLLQLLQLLSLTFLTALFGLGGRTQNHIEVLSLLETLNNVVRQNIEYWSRLSARRWRLCRKVLVFVRRCPILSITSRKSAYHLIKTFNSVVIRKQPINGDREGYEEGKPLELKAIASEVLSRANLPSFDETLPRSWRWIVRHDDAEL